MNKLNIGSNIKKIRKSKGLTQLYVSQLLGYSSSSSLSEIENGKKKIDADKIYLLSKIMNISIENFFSEHSQNEI